MKRSEKPPFGVKPRYLLDEERINELKEAIGRFLESNWPIPDEITAEYNYLTERLEVEGENYLSRIERLKSMK